MHKKRCTRCGKREGFRESFVPIRCVGIDVPLCAQCDQILYKMKDAVTDGDIPLFNQLSMDFINGLKAGPLYDSLLDWFTNYKNSIYK